MRFIFALLVAGSIGCGYANKIKNLSDAEYAHWSALRVYMEEDARKSYFKLKTEEERNQWLKDEGLWDRFYQYDPHIRERIVGLEVQVGWTKDMVYMAWGIPYDRRKLTRQAERSEMFIYRFEQHTDRIMVWERGSKTAYKAERFFVKEVIMEDDRVVEMSNKEASW